MDTLKIRFEGKAIDHFNQLVDYETPLEQRQFIRIMPMFPTDQTDFLTAPGDVIPCVAMVRQNEKTLQICDELVDREYAKRFVEDATYLEPTVIKVRGLFFSVNFQNFIFEI